MAPALQPDKPKLPKPTVGFVQARKLQLSTKPFSSPPTRDELEKTQKWAPNANLASTFPPNGSIPWERFATSDKPLVFNSTSYTARAGTYSFLWGCGYDCYSHRTQCCYPVAQCLIRSGAGGAEWASVKEAGFEAMFEKVLKTGASPDTPPSLLGLWYMRGNIAPPETLFTVHDAEWVKTAEGGYIGLKHQSYNWSADATCWGWLWMRFRPTAPFRFEVSPDGKWVNVAGSQQWAYLLQPGDRVTNAQESDAILASWVEESKAGDWMRYSYDDQAQLKGAGGYMYAWEKIAFLDDDGKLKLTPAYQSFLADVERAKARRAPCGTGCCWSGMQATEALTELSEVQGWQIAPPAPIATMER